MAQHLRPSADNGSGTHDNWSSPAYSNINEASFDDSTYTARTAQAGVAVGYSDLHKMQLSAGATPADITACIIHLRLRRLVASSSTNDQIYVYIKDLASGAVDGGTFVTFADSIAIDGAFHAFNIAYNATTLVALAGGSVNWANLEIWIEANCQGGGTTSSIRLSYLDFETSDPQWWRLTDEIVDGLRYRFSLVRNWYRVAASSPGTGWATSAVPAAFGVFQSTDGYTGAATVINAGLPASPRSFAEISAFATGATETLGGSPGMGAVFDNVLIYPAKTYTVGTDLPPIRIYDGISDREFVRLPKTAAGVVPKAILSMLVANGTVYVSTFDSGTTSADWAGRVFALSLTDGTLTMVGDDVFASGQLPYALAWHANQLWVGTHRQAFGVKGALYRIRPELTNPTWTKDADLTANSSVSSLLSYAGKLYIGTMYASGAFAKVLVRDYAGVYTTSDTGTGGSAVDGNGYLALCQFGDNLYAAFWNNDTSPVAKIRKFDGSSWSTVYSTIAMPFGVLFVESGYLYAYSVGLSLPVSLVRSADGTSWTDLSAQMVGSSQGLPLVGVVVR